MAMTYESMTSAQKRIFDLITEDSEKIRAARAGIGLDVLAKSENVAVRINVAQNTETPVDVLETLYEDDHPYVVSAVLSNPSTPKDVLLDAIKQNRGNYTAIACNPGITDDVAHKLIETKDSAFISCLAGNKHISKEIMKEIVRLDSAGRAPGHAQLANNPSATPDIVEILSLSPSKNARINVAIRPELGDGWKVMLAEDRSLEVRLNLAKNKELPIEAQRILAKDGSANVVQALAGNPHTDSTILEEILDMTLDIDDPEKMPGLLLSSLAENENLPPSAFVKILETERLAHQGVNRYSAMRAAASNPSTPESVLEKIFERGDDTLKVLVLRNPSTENRFIVKCTRSKTLTSEVHETAIGEALGRVPGFRENYAEANLLLPVDALIRADSWKELEAGVFPTPNDFVKCETAPNVMRGYRWENPKIKQVVEIGEAETGVWFSSVDVGRGKTVTFAENADEAYSNASKIFKIECSRVGLEVLPCELTEKTAGRNPVEETFLELDKSFSKGSARSDERICIANPFATPEKVRAIARS